MFFVKYVFYFTREVDNNYISFMTKWLRHSWNINIIHFTCEIKDIFNKKIWMASIYYMLDRKIPWFIKQIK